MENTTGLTAQDRCDRCGAQAYARTWHEHSTLDWCAHHLREHKALLMPHLILDETHLLAPKVKETVEA